MVGLVAPGSFRGLRRERTGTEENADGHYE